jgi:hypothetical protein
MSEKLYGYFSMQCYKTGMVTGPVAYNRPRMRFDFASGTYSLDWESVEHSIVASVYRLKLTGAEVTVTAIGNTPNPLEGKYSWADTICVGELDPGSWVRNIRAGA